MKKFLAIILLTLGILLIPNSVSATTFDLVAPTEQLVKGQNVKFTVNIDTEGKSLSTASIGMTYETKYLEYVSTSPGNSFTTVSADVQSDGRLIITGSGAPYSGAGTFAYVTFKLIATSSGSTQLCVLFNPTSVTPTPGPTSGGATSSPAPTALPKTGQSAPTTNGIILASFFFILSAGSFFIIKKI
jgi:hypothetical protein